MKNRTQPTGAADQPNPGVRAPRFAGRDIGGLSKATTTEPTTNRLADTDWPGQVEPGGFAPGGKRSGRSPETALTNRAGIPAPAHSEACSFADHSGSDTARSGLESQLLLSVTDVDNKVASLAGASRRLASAIDTRVASEARLIAQAIRLTIGLIWLSVGIALLISAGQEDAAGLISNGFVNGMPQSHAYGIARIFLIAALPASLIAIFAYIYIRQSTGSGLHVRQAADRLGQEIAGHARTLYDDISALIDRTNRAPHAADRVEPLVRAHQKAFETQYFFRKLSFLTADRKTSLASLEAFLPGAAGIPAGLVFGAGYLIGTGVTALLFTDGPRLDPAIIRQLSGPDIFQYEGFLITLVGLAFLYVIVGMICDLLIPFFGATRRQAIEDALDVLRGAVTANNAPRKAEILQRIEDAEAAFVDHLRTLESDAARGKREGTRNGDPEHRLNGDKQKRGDNDLSWRHRDTDLQFVDSGFQAAPPQFSHADSALVPPDHRANTKNRRRN